MVELGDGGGAAGTCCRCCVSCLLVSFFSMATRGDTQRDGLASGVARPEVLLGEVKGVQDALLWGCCSASMASIRPMRDA